jgi:hypothetical protein
MPLIFPKYQKVACFLDRKLIRALNETVYSHTKWLKIY